MKVYVLLCFFFFIVVIYLGYSSKGNITSTPGMVPVESNDMTLTSMWKSRKLKENSHFPSSDGDDEGHVELEDYRPIDPVPSSKASIRPGPIQHGTPLMPYIPKPCPSPPPPSQQPKHGG